MEPARTGLGEARLLTGIRRTGIYLPAPPKGSNEGKLAGGSEAGAASAACWANFALLAAFSSSDIALSAFCFRAVRLAVMVPKLAVISLAISSRVISSSEASTSSVSAPVAFSLELARCSLALASCSLAAWMLARNS